MEPRIQYAQTEDGASIAFWKKGSGPTLVCMPALLETPMKAELQAEASCAWYQRLARGHTVVRFDPRGCGLSQQAALKYSLETFVADLDAVISAAGTDQVDLWAERTAGAVAIRLAAEQPERVRSLILWFAYARPLDLPESERETFRYLDGLVETNWPLLTETIVGQVGGWRAPDAREFAAVIRESLEPRAWRAFLDTVWAWDVSTLLRSIACPVLVAQRSEHPLWPVRTSLDLAAGIPGAELALLKGDAMYPWIGDMEEVARAIDVFLGTAEPEGAPVPHALPHGMAVILFADIVESTALTEELGDAAFRDKARELDTSLRAVIRECSGTPVEGKVLGDGVLAVFTSARQAIECALRCGAASDSVDLRLHLGIHAGDVIREEDPDGRANVYGGAVNIAARIADASAPGEVLVSDTVRSLARTSAGVAFDDRGEHELKGGADPQRLYAVRGRG